MVLYIGLTVVLLVKMTVNKNVEMVSPPKVASFEVKRKDYRNDPEYKLLKETIEINCSFGGSLGITAFEHDGEVSYNISIHHEKNTKTTIFVSLDNSSLEVTSFDTFKSIDVSGV